MDRGKNVNLLSALNVGESFVIESQVKHTASLWHVTALRMGIKVVVRKVKDNAYRVWRIK